MAALNAEKTGQISSILNKYCRKYISVQELNYALHEIAKDPTEETVNRVQGILRQADKEFIKTQTVNTKSITNNQVMFAMSEIRKIVLEKEEPAKPTTPSGGDSGKTEEPDDKTGDSGKAETGGES